MSVGVCEWAVDPAMGIPQAWAAGGSTAWPAWTRRRCEIEWVEALWADEARLESAHSRDQHYWEVPRLRCLDRHCELAGGLGSPGRAALTGPGAIWGTAADEPEGLTWPGDHGSATPVEPVVLQCMCAKLQR